MSTTAITAAWPEQLTRARHLIAFNLDRRNHRPLYWEAALDPRGRAAFSATHPGRGRLTAWLLGTTPPGGVDERYRSVLRQRAVCTVARAAKADPIAGQALAVLESMETMISGLVRDLGVTLVVAARTADTDVVRQGENWDARVVAERQLNEATAAFVAAAAMVGGKPVPMAPAPTGRWEVPSHLAERSHPGLLSAVARLGRILEQRA